MYTLAKALPYVQPPLAHLREPEDFTILDSIPQPGEEEMKGYLAAMETKQYSFGRIYGFIYFISSNLYPTLSPP